MKIFYIDPQSYNNLADYDKYLLENMNCTVSFFCSDNMPYEEIAATKLIHLYNYHSKKNILKIFSYILSQKKLFKLIKTECPDIVHFQWFKIPFFDLYLIKKIRKATSSVKIIHTAHNVLPHDSGAKFVNIYRKIYSAVDKIIVHAEVTKLELISDFSIDEKKICVIPHGYLPVKHKFPKKSAIDDVITFSFIGILSEYKGLDILLDAWCNNPAIINNTKCRLVIAGKGDLPCLKKIPENKNIILENYFHTEEELSKVIAETDVAFLPYRKISQSGVLLTFLAEHIPIVVSNIGGLTQPFEIGKIGWIIENLTADSVANLIEKIISKPDEMHSIKNNSELWRKIDDFYDWKNISRKTLNLYQKK